MIIQQVSCVALFRRLFSHAVEIKSEKMGIHANTILTGTHFLRMVTCNQVSLFVYLFLGWAIVSAIVFCGNIYIFFATRI